ncbi:MAG: ATP-grasp domain-containing protein [Gammaproteobacteria bacterium]|nr:ATP-grasp domain-containing protein [Gammaproteobacteria bacterium]
MVRVGSNALIVVAGSARAVACSAARAGYAPWWIDRYGDVDLAHRFPGTRTGAADFPAAILAACRAAPSAPLVYGAPLENEFALLEALADIRPLAGNDADTCRAVRDPARVTACLRAAGLPAANVVTSATVPPPGRAWLLKPRAGAGGIGIREHVDGQGFDCTSHYLQAYLPGDGYGAVFLGDGRRACLCGVTGHLRDLPDLGAARFAYCGSIGPCALDAATRECWEAIGAAVVAAFGLRGLFGVDAIDTAGTLCPVEINPRYSASVELLEHAGAGPLLRHHCDACAGRLPAVAPADRLATSACFAKAYVFAPRAVRAPASWSGASPVAAGDAPVLADLPAAGTRIADAEPLVTVFARAATPALCRALLLQRARAALAQCR